MSALHMQKLSAFFTPLIGVIWLITLIFTPINTWAQNDVEEWQTPDNLSLEIFEASKAGLENIANLTDEQISIANELYDTGINALRNATTNIETANRFRSELQNGQNIIAELENEVNGLRETINSQEPDDASTPLNRSRFNQIQQDLITQEGELRALRSEIGRYDAGLQNLLQRPLTAREELANARERLGELSSTLTEFGEGELDSLGQVRRDTLRARQYFERSQAFVLEEEIAGLATRQQILSLRQSLTQIRVTQAEQQVARLQSITGRNKILEAENINDQNLLNFQALTGNHPALLAYASENISFGQELKVIAVRIASFPEIETDANSRLEIITDDLDVAQSLVELGNLNRQSSATLRQLRNQRESMSSLRRQFQESRREVITSTQNRLLSQNRLRDFPVGDIDVETYEADWRALNPESRTFTDSEKTILRDLHNQRRFILSEIAEAASKRASRAAEIQSLRADILSNAEKIRELLDRNLLWLPSVNAIDLDWPKRVYNGVLKTFSPKNMVTVSNVFQDGIVLNFFFLILLIIFLILLFFLRPGLNRFIASRAARVGPVRQDSYWHSPATAFVCALIALPVPLALAYIGLVFGLSDNPDPIISAISLTSADLAGISLFLLTWRQWNLKGSLFDAHYNLTPVIRDNIDEALRWFIPAVLISIGLVTLTQNSRDLDVYEGLSLVAFIMTTLLMSSFSLRVMWSKRDIIRQTLPKESVFWRYRTLIAMLIIALPILAATLAALGYYDTARELLSRLFFTTCTLIFTYMVYGLIRRSVLVAQRRIALSQALQRRELQRQRREEEKLAQQDDIDLPKLQVDFDSIDIATINRQTLQLMNTIVVVGLLVLMWILWQDLLPALSVFNDVSLWTHEHHNIDGSIEENRVTLWSLIQAIAILMITFMAARNLPGFLEISILNRSRIEPATRYALVTVLGYIIVALGIIMAFSRLGTQWSQLQWIVAALGVGIGFGLQEIIANFISGLIILFERPIRLGDYVTIGDQSGSVSRIKIRATTLTDLDRREILIPNKEIITGRVTNWTLSNSITRMIIPVGIAYGSDTDKAKDIIQNVLTDIPKVLETPPPQVFFLGFGESSLDFELRIFISGYEERYPVSHIVHTKVNKALEAAGINIPFPQRDIHIVEPERDPIGAKPPAGKAKTTPKSKSANKPKSKPKSV